MNLWTQDREASQPISMATFQQHINAESGSNATFDSMWARMQTIIGKHIAASTSLRGIAGTSSAQEWACIAACYTSVRSLLMLHCCYSYSFFARKSINTCAAPHFSFGASNKQAVTKHTV